MKNQDRMIMFQIIFCIIIYTDITTSGDDILSNEDEISCIICMQEIERSDLKKCEAQCSANFHVDCWNQCMRYMRRCPQCRQFQYGSLLSLHTRQFDSGLYSGIPAIQTSDELGICNIFGDCCRCFCTCFCGILECFLCLAVLGLIIVALNGHYQN